MSSSFRGEFYFHAVAAAPAAAPPVQPPAAQPAPLSAEELEPAAWNAITGSSNHRRRIQAALTAKGFDTIGTDGAFGPRTRQMIGNWQSTRNEPPTGFLTATQAALLSQEGQSALAKIEDERRKAAPAPTPAPQAVPPQQAAAPAPAAPAMGKHDGKWAGATTVMTVTLVVAGQTGKLGVSCGGHSVHADVTIGPDGAIDTYIGGRAQALARRCVTGRLPTLTVGIAGGCGGGTVTLLR